MKSSMNKPAETAQTEVFPKVLYRLRPDSKQTTANSKPQKRNNVFSKSRDTREDRGVRRAKTSRGR
jgi:hypothetical protein